MIYLDHNATTPLDPRVLAAMQPYLTSIYGNPSALHRLGRIARSAIDHAREQVAELVDAQPEQIVFTSGGSEANALALKAYASAKAVASRLEHPSVFEQLPFLTVPVCPSGIVDVEAIIDYSWQAGDCLALMLANNETGAIQPVEAISDLMAQRGVHLHCDAVQAVGKMPVSFKSLGVASMSLSAHKLYGPKGCGALVMAEPAQFCPLWGGGDQEFGLRSGTENVAAIVGFGCAAALAKQELEQRSRHLFLLRTALERCLKTLAKVCIFADTAERLPNTVQFAMAGHSGEMLVMQLDREGIAVSSGSACAADSGVLSPVLNAMGVDAELARGAIRVSFGRQNSLHDVDKLFQLVQQIHG
jgi:cysteine desulfurase